MGKNNIIYHNGVKIYHLDLSNLKTEAEIGAVLSESKTYIHAQPKSSVFSLVTVTGMHFNNNIKDLLVNVVKSNKPFVKASAVVGVEGLLKVMFNGFMNLSGREVKSFSTLEQAKDWLVSKENQSQFATA